MTATYFSSDWHINHKNICNFRQQFKTVEEHNELIFDNYCSVVRPKDTVYLLGDVAFNKEALVLIKKLPGIKHLVMGNHDKEKKRDITLQDLVDTYHDIHGFLRYKEFWLSHCPIAEQELRGRISVHGHVHFQIISSNQYLNVCLENTNYKPVSLETLRKCIQEGKIYDLNN